MHQAYTEQAKEVTENEAQERQRNIGLGKIIY